MKLARSNNLVTNLKWGIVYRFSGILIPFVCKAAIIRIFGINYLGLNSLFTSILSTLNLAEMGFGSAVVFFMYKAIADENVDEICRLLNYYKKVYRTIGCIVLGIGLLLMPFLKFLIKKDIPEDINIYIIYLITLSATVISYFLFAYKTSILTAFQRESVLYKIRAFVLIAESILQIISIFLFRNYYMYLLITVISAAANNIMADHYIRNNYPQYVAKGDVTKDVRREIGEKIKGLIFYKIGGVIVTSADSIVISMFLGLTISGIYGNYYYVITLLFGVLAVYYTSFRAGLGNSVVTENFEKNYSTFCQLQFVQNWLIGFCTTCLLCLYQDFISVYAGKDNKLSIGIVICLCLLFYTWKIQDIAYVYKEACGFWTKDKYRPLIGSLLNLMLNIISIQFIGLYGVILSTVCIAVSIDLIWSPKALFNDYFKKSRKEYYLMLIHGVVNCLVMCVITYYLTSLIDTGHSLANFAIKMVVCAIVPNILFFVINYKRQEMDMLLKRVKRIVCRKTH